MVLIFYYNFKFVGIKHASNQDDLPTQVIGVSITPHLRMEPSPVSFHALSILVNQKLHLHGVEVFTLSVITMVFIIFTYHNTIS